MNQSNKPLDPSKVKAGDTVTLEYGSALVRDVVIEAKSRGVGQFVFYTAENPDPLIPGTYYLVNSGAWTLTDHQPAPEPGPEYRLGTVYGADGQSERYWFSDDGSAEGAMFRNDVGDEYAPSELAHLDLKALVVIDPEKVDVDALAAAIRKAEETGGPFTATTTRLAHAALAHLGIGK